IIIDDSTSSKDGVKSGHGIPGSDESKAAKRLRASAGAGAVTRTHFHNLQHNKIFFTRKKGIAQKVLCGSTNFTYRGLFIQANNLLVFHAPEVAGLFAGMFDLAFDDPMNFRKDPYSEK